MIVAVHDKATGARHAFCHELLALPQWHAVVEPGSTPLYSVAWDPLDDAIWKELRCKARRAPLPIRMITLLPHYCHGDTSPLGGGAAPGLPPTRLRLLDGEP